MAIARVQSKTATTGPTNATSLALVLDAATTNGNILILALVCAGSTNPTVSTNADIAWIGSTKPNSSSVNISLFIGYVRTGSASATITMNQVAALQMAAVCAEYSGFSHAQFDTAANATGTSTLPASGSTPSTRSSAELWVTAIGQRTNNTVTFSSPTNSFSIVGQTGSTIGGANADRSVCLLERIVASTGTANGGATSAQSAAWIAYTITIDDAGAGTPTEPVGGFFVV